MSVMETKLAMVARTDELRLLGLAQFFVDNPDKFKFVTDRMNEIVAENELPKREYTQTEVEDILINLGQAERYNGMFVNGDCTFGIGKDIFFVYSNKRPNKQLLDAFKDASNVSVRHGGKITAGPAK